MARRDPRPFRFGAGPGGLHPVDARRWAELARQVEALGYSTLSVSDHAMHYGPFTAMGVAAGVTTTLRVGTLVLGNDFHHPALLAREAMTLDALSGGRLELGMGAGWMKADYDVLSLPFDPPQERIARLREAIGIVRALLRGETCAVHGDHYAVDGLHLEMRGDTAGSIPLLLAGSGDTMLTLAAEEADIVGVNMNLAGGTWSNDIWKSATGVSTEHKVRLLDERTAHRAPAPERQIVAHVTKVTNERDAGLDAVARTWNLPVEAVAASPHVLVGSVDAIVEQLEAGRERYGFSYITVDATVVEEFAPVVARLAGR